MIDCERFPKEKYMSLKKRVYCVALSAVEYDLPCFLSVCPASYQTLALFSRGGLWDEVLHLDHSHSVSPLSTLAILLASPYSQEEV